MPITDTSKNERLTVILDPHTIKRLKHAAIEEGRTLSDLVKDAAEHYLRTQKTQRS